MIKINITFNKKIDWKKTGDLSLCWTSYTQSKIAIDF